MRHELKKFLILVLSPLIKLKKMLYLLSVPQVIYSPNTIDIVRKNAISTSAEYISNNLSEAMVFSDRRDLWKLTSKIAKTNGVFLEFGVSGGKSINFFAEILDPLIEMHGFDSFLGLEESYKGTEWTVGSFSTGGKIPKLNKRIKIHEGWFNQSLPKFVSNFRQPISILHIDSDTYNSTKYVLTSIKKFLVSGSLVLFDEYHGHPNWENGEFKAWQEFITRNHLKYEYLGFSPHAALVRLVK